jgi:hypothetical protein
VLGTRVVDGAFVVVGVIVVVVGASVVEGLSVVVATTVALVVVGVVELLVQAVSSASVAMVRAVERFIVLAARRGEHRLEVVRLSGGVRVTERLPAELEPVVVSPLCIGATRRRELAVCPGELGAERLVLRP